MTHYHAIINTPGYSPWADEPATFEKPVEAWAYLAEERERQEDQTEGEEYTETHVILGALGTAAHWEHAQREPWLFANGIAADGTGVIFGDTPGYDGDHDLGLAYSVTACAETECEVEE